MTVQTKGRIRHVALSVKDPWETAEFYKQALGLEEVVELDGPLAGVEHRVREHDVDLQRWHGPGRYLPA